MTETKRKKKDNYYPLNDRFLAIRKHPVYKNSIKLEKEVKGKEDFTKLVRKNFNLPIHWQQIMELEMRGLNMSKVSLANGGGIVYGLGKEYNYMGILIGIDSNIKSVRKFYGKIKERYKEKGLVVIDKREASIKVVELKDNNVTGISSFIFIIKPNATRPLLIKKFNEVLEKYKKLGLRKIIKKSSSREMEVDAYILTMQGENNKEIIKKLKIKYPNVGWLNVSNINNIKKRGRQIIFNY